MRLARPPVTAPLFARLLWRHGAGEAVQPLTEEQIMPSLSSPLEWGEENEDGHVSVTGPDWIINNVGHYGG
ncbi:hypothetical protein HA38_11510 [Pantoea allii]|nr:hypothetical protein HA38_11510 [Pantoea allii]PBK00786.1 hypothetical protein CMR03_08620 [Pantoea allii]